MGNLQLPKKKPSIFDRVVAQVTPFDNGRTYQNQTPQNNRSVIAQATHNGLTNLAGNLTVKPVVSTVNLPYHAGQLAAANLTHNVQAAQNARTQLGNNYNASIPGFVANNVKNAAIVASTVPQAIRTDYRGFQGKAPTPQEQANLHRGLSAFNQTTVGQMLSPVQDQINKRIPTAKEASAAAGYNVNASGAQKYFADPVMGTIGTAGLLKGGSVAAKGGKRVVVSAKNAAEDAAARRTIAKTIDKTAAKTPTDIATTDAANTLKLSGKKTIIPVQDLSVPSKTTAKLPIRAIPSHEELVQRYNDHMAALSREFSRGAKQITLAGRKGRQAVLAEPNVYNDVNYAAKKQQIQQQYKDGTLPKIIQVKDAPKTGKVNVTKDPGVKADAIAAKAQAEGRPMTNGEQIKVAQLDKAAGRNNAAPQPAPVETPPPGQVPLNLGKPTPASVAPKAPNAVNRAWQSTSGVISQFGKTGKELAKRLNEHRNQSELGQEKFYEQIPSVAKLGKEDFQSFVQTLENRSKGDMSQVAPHIEQAITEWNKAIPQIRERALRAGISVGDLGPNYFPRVYKDLFTRDQAFVKLAQSMVDAGKAPDLATAIDNLQFMKKDYLHQFGNLENTRAIDMPGYEMTHDALTGYVNRAFDRISKAEQFGPNGELIGKMQEHMQKEGYNAVSPDSVVNKQLKIALGDVNKNTGAYKASGAMRTFNAYRSLGTAGISNASQLTNTATVAGILRTAKAVAKMTKQTTRDEARASGVLLDHSINNLSAQQLGVRGKIARNVASPFFQSIEKFNRATTAVVGKDFGNHLAKTGDHAMLREKFGVTGEIGKTLTKDQENQVARKLVEIAQFKVDPMDLPGWVDSPIGKLASQFRTFGYKQTGFMYNEVARQALKGNFVPLARFVAVGAPLGTASIAIKGAIKNRPMTSGDNNVEKFLLNPLAAVGGGGLPASEAQNFASNMKYDGTAGAVTAAALGPTGSFLNQTGSSIDQARQGNFKPLAKQAVSTIPAVGVPIANRIPALKPTVKVTGNGVGSTATTATDQPQIKADSSKQLADFRKQYEFKTDSGYGLTKLPDGKYVYNLNGTVKTADTLKKARDAIAGDTLKQSGESIKIVGDTVYRKNAQGDVTPTPKIKYDYAVGKAMMTAQENGKDYAGWRKTALGQIDSINKQLNDPAIDPLDALNLQNEAAAIYKKLDKYAQQGGFSGSSSSSTINKVNAAQYLKSQSFAQPTQTRAVSVPKVSVRARSRGSGSGRIKVTSKKAAR